MARKAAQAPDVFADMVFPVRGVDLSEGFALQTPGTTPVGENVRLMEPGTLRARGGSRPGLSKYVAQQLPTGPVLIQMLDIVVDPTTEANLDEDDGDFEDPSSDGPESSWGPFRSSRLPRRRLLRRGGNGRMRGKNPKRPRGATRTIIFTGTAVASPDLLSSPPDPPLYNGQLVETESTLDISVEQAPLCGAFDRGPPLRTWRIRRYFFVGDFHSYGQPDPGDPENTDDHFFGFVVGEGVTLATGDAGIELPDTIDAYDLEFAPPQATPGMPPDEGFYGYQYVLETQSFTGAWPEPPTEIRSNRLCSFLPES